MTPNDLEHRLISDNTCVHRKCASWRMTSSLEPGKSALRCLRYWCRLTLWYVHLTFSYSRGQSKTTGHSISVLTAVFDFGARRSDVNVTRLVYRRVTALYPHSVDGWPCACWPRALFLIRPVRWPVPGKSLPRDAVRKRGLCCRPVSVCLSVCLSHWCVVSRRLKISSNFFLGPVATSF